MRHPVRRARFRADQEAGFTLIEMVIAITLMAGVLLSMAFVLHGGMGALTAARQRSAFIEVANAEMESLRATPYSSVGVNTGDPDRSTAYTGGTSYEGRDAVILASGAPAAVSLVTSSTVKGIVLPYTVRRWVTWTDTFGGTAHQFKRLVVQVEWKENNRNQRSFKLTSVLYPGAQGVVSSNQPPVAAIATPNPTSGPAGTTFAFDGAGSTDPDGDAVTTWSWNFGDGTTGTGTTASHAYNTDGNYTVTLTVVDARGATSQPVSRNITVGSGTNPPTASFTYNPMDGGTAPLSVNFASTSSGERPIATWDWDWGDGTPHGTTESPTHIFASAGTYTVRLTVTDTGGLTASTTVSITVTPLNCDTTGGSFRNPGTNAVANDIRVNGGNNKVTDTAFTFTATTNAACTGVTARLPRQGGTLVVTLTLQSETGGVKTWGGTTTVGSNDRFNLGTNQTASMTGTEGVNTDVFSYPFNVHT